MQLHVRVMKLNPQQAPLYGDCVITVLLTEEDELEDDVVFYLVFTGSTVQHCTSTRKINRGTLETIAPGHDCCETVKVALCTAKEGLPVLVVAEESFQFIQDEAYDAAQFLATCAGNQQALNFTRFLDRSRPPSGDVDFLDEKVALAFRHLKLPAEWNVLGTDQTLNESSPRETLLHFAVRLGLLRLTWFLLQQPGGRGALCIHNNEGATPVSLALERGYQKLHQLLTEEEAGEPDSWSTLSHIVHSGDYCVKYHLGLNVYTLTAEAKEGAKASMEHDIEQLRQYIASHQHTILTHPCKEKASYILRAEEHCLEHRVAPCSVVGSVGGECENAAKQPEPELRTSEDNCNIGTEVEGFPAAAASLSEEMPTEESKECPSALVNFDVRQLSAPTGQKENQCDSGSLAVLNDTSSDLLSLAGIDNPEFSCESKNTATLSKKEEEGPAAIVDSGTVSDKNDCTLSSGSGVSGAASLPSCGNTNAETGMTSSGVVLSQASLCSRDNTQQEVQIVEECATESAVTVAETACEAPTPFEGVDVAMGQAECKNCTGSVDAASIQQHVENGEDETRGLRTSSLKELPPASGVLIHASEPLLAVSPKSPREGGECGAGQGMQAQDNANVRVDSDIIPVGHWETSGSKESGTDSNTKNAKIGLPEGVVQGEPLVKQRQSMIPNTREELLVVTEIKVSENALERDPVVLEVNNNRKSGEQGVQVENGNADIGLNELVLSDNVRNNSEMKNNPLDRPGPSDAESVCCLESSKTIAILAEGEGDSEALKKMSPRTETTGRGNTDSAEEGQRSAGNCHTENQAVLKGEMCDSLKPETASASKCEPGSQPPLDAGLSSAEKEHLPNRLVTSESISEQEGVGKQMKSFSSPLFKGDVQQGQAVGQERDAAVAPPGQEASVHGNDPVFSSCGMGTECIQDNLMDTPSAIHNKESKQNQEVAAGAETAVLAEQDSSVHRKITAETGLPKDSVEKEDSDEKSLSQPAEESKAEPSQELCESGTLGKEKGLSEEPAATVKSSVCRQGEESAANDSNADIGLKGEISCQEADDNATVDAEESIVQGSESEYKSLDAKNDPPPDAMLNQERDLSQGAQGGSLQNKAPELKEVSVMEAPSVAFENRAPLGIAETSTIPGDPEEEEDMNNVLSRASLQPIAEEPPCDSDSSTDTVCLASESEAGSEVKEAQQQVLDWPNKDQEEQSNAMLEACLSQSHPYNINAAAELTDDAGAKSLVPEADGSWLDGFVSILETPSVPESAVGKLESVPVGVLPPSPSKAGVITGDILNGEMDLSLQFDEPTKRGDASSEVLGSEPVTEKLEMKIEDEVDFLKDLREHAVSEGTINRESWCSIEPCSDPSLLEPTQTHESRECEHFLEDGLSGDCASSQGVLKRETGIESELFPLPGDGMDDIVFGKQPEEEPCACDVTSYSSSADDTVSLERNSSLGSDISLPHALNLNRPKERHTVDGSCINMGAAGGRESELGGSGEMEEEMDSITEVPAHSSVLRNSMRPLSPFRRHSWGPGKNAANEAEINHRSSMRVLGDGIRKPPIHRRSLSWCPSGVQYITMGADFNCRSYSLEGLAGDSDDNKKPSSNLETSSLSSKDLRRSPLANDERGSLVSLTEEEVESEQGEIRGFDHQTRQRSQPHGFNFCTSATSPLTKSISLMTITQPGLDTQRRTRPSGRISFSFNISPLIPKSKTLFSIGSSSSDEEEEELDSTRSFNSTSSSLSQSVSEESGNFLPPSPSRKDLEGKSGTKVSRTFSYLRNKMSSSKKSKEKEKDKEKTKEKDKDSKEKEKDKKMLNGHLFSAAPTVGPINCYHCMKPFNKDSYLCANCNAIVHKGCKESLISCAKVKMKLQKGMLQAHDTSSLPTVIMRNKTSQPKERPRSAILAPDESTVTSIFNNRRSQQTTTLSKSVSIQNIAGVGSDESIVHTWKFLSQSTDSLHKISRVNESTESLTDEGADMNEGQLMGDFEMDSKQLEAESWSQVVDSKFLRQQKKDVVKRQDVIYELMQTEMHHVRTLKIMSDVYSRGMLEELQFEQQMVEKVFPCLDDLLNIHNQFFQRILERKKESLMDKSEKNFVIKRIGDILVNQFSGENGERMKKTYGKFCGHHNEAVNYFKDLQSKEKRFQAFIKKKMSSTVVRRLGIPECILLVTQRITKYPVILQRILQYTKENEVEHQDLTQSLNLVKDVIAAVNSKVNNYEKKTRLTEIYTRTDSKSIMRMKSGQMFAKEDLRRRKLIRDGPVSLKNSAGRLKEVQAVLLSDMLIFLQEKDQKYVFASLDQRSTVISLKKLIVREVAHEEKGLFLITTVVKDPEMVEVHASSKEERNSWIQIIQDTINTMDKDEDEGIPSESELEKRVLDTKARELKEQLQQKDQQILVLLEEKEKIFRDMTDCSMPEDGSVSRVLFRSNTEEAHKGETIMKSAINEVEYLQSLISRSLGSALGAADLLPNAEQEGGVGPISLPRRAETFGGFDSHQMNASKCGEKDESDDAQDLRRTESDSILKKGGNANLMFVLKRNNEHVLQSITYLHKLLSTLQAVVLQQDTYIEDQKLVLSERALTRSSSRPNSLIEQEKQRSLEKQRQELANLQKQQAQHQEEKRRREKEWEAREKELTEREVRLAQREEQAQKGHKDLEREREELKRRKEAYQMDLERLRAAQKQLEREKDQLKRDVSRLPPVQMEPDLRQVSNPHDKTVRIPSQPTAEDSMQHGSSLPKQGHFDAGLSVSPKRNSLSRTHKEKGTFHLLSATNQTNKAAEVQQPTRLFGLSKPKEKKDKKKKGKGHRSQPADAHSSEAPPEGEEIFC
ncbi:A-kinase anchor protein 13 isoform X2 [Chelonia mydas]|uniref:A-kinase anchor protein 13 isoform X2 n=1 Tax=Chelonia mydas TaxID=8469 RepID=UPI001CA923A8|nr:A-kinase anchor protein 13 isoform X2 [Chelonia mydas]